MDDGTLFKEETNDGQVFKVYINTLWKEIRENFKVFSDALWFVSINGKVVIEDNETNKAFDTINIENTKLNNECNIPSMEKDKCS